MFTKVAISKKTNVIYCLANFGLTLSAWRLSCSIAACTGNRLESTNFGWIPSMVSAFRTTTSMSQYVSHSFCCFIENNHTWVYLELSLEPCLAHNLKQTDEEESNSDPYPRSSLSQPLCHCNNLQTDWKRFYVLILIKRDWVCFYWKLRLIFSFFHSYISATLDSWCLIFLIFVL